MFEFLVISTAFAGLITASINDFKTREVPDYLSYSFIAAAVFLRIFWFVATLDFSVLFWIPLSLGIMAGFGYTMYRTGQWGGGDVKIIIALAVLLSSFPGEIFPFFSAFFLNSLIMGAVYGSIMILFISLKNAKTVKKMLSKTDYFIFVSAISSAVVCILFLDRVFAFFGVLIALMLGMVKLSKLIETNLMQKYVPVESLTEGDWLVNEVRCGKDIVKKREVGLILKDLKLLKKLAKEGKLKKVKIKIGIPFVPAFLLNLIVTLSFGNIMFRLISVVV